MEEKKSAVILVSILSSTKILLNIQKEQQNMLRRKVILGEFKSTNIN